MAVVQSYGSLFARRTVAAVLLLSAGAVARAGAQAPPPDLDEVVAAALRANPDLVGARLRADSARAERQIARALPNPTYTAIPNVPYQHSITEPVDFGPQRLYRTRAASDGVQAADLDQIDVARQVTFAARQAFMDLLLAQALREVAADQRDIVLQILASDSARVRSGDAPERNLVAGEVQLARAETALARAEAGLRGARLALQQIMGVSSLDTALTVRGELRYRPVEIPAESLAPLAAANRPDLAAARLRVAQSQALRSLANAQLVPTPAVTITYQQGQPFGNGRQYQFGGVFTLPLFHWYGGERRRARDAEAAASLQLRRIQVQLGADVVAALDSYRASRTLAERYEAGLLDKARAALETARYAYRAGAASRLDLLEAIRAWADTRADYYTAVHDYWVSVYALDRALGRDLVR